MADIVSSEIRSRMMSWICSRDIIPEKVVRSAVHRMSFRFRLYCRYIPVRPDIVLPQHRKTIFVHGCFWHCHAGCRLASAPSNNTEYWMENFSANVTRDQRATHEFQKLGWNVLVVWECEAREPQWSGEALSTFLCGSAVTASEAHITAPCC